MVNIDFIFDAKNYYNFYNTLDIDYELLPEISESCSKEKIKRIFNKISTCKFLKDIKQEPSNKKGYHIRLYCSISCYKCRMVFDDDIRFNADSARRKEFTNIIFDQKKGY
jgi:hypothetical protein